MAMGPFAYFVGVQGSRAYTNFTSTDEHNKADEIDSIRKKSVAERMTSGAHPPVAYFNKKYLEKHLKTNSAMRNHADDIREAHAKANGA